MLPALTKLTKSFQESLLNFSTIVPERWSKTTGKELWASRRVFKRALENDTDTRLQSWELSFEEEDKKKIEDYADTTQMPSYTIIEECFPQ